MGKTYIPITEANKKNILNFIGMCRMNGLEGMAEPSFSFKDIREDIGTVIFDVFYNCRGITEPSWNMTVKVDSDVRFHDSHKWHGFSHAHTALLNASTRFSLTDKEKDIIAHHMWPLNLTKVPRSREALLVCLVDKYCSTVETLTKRSAQA